MRTNEIAEINEILRRNETGLCDEMIILRWRYHSIISDKLVEELKRLNFRLFE